ncbi:acyl-coenzyme A thioesterase 13-like [Pyrus ussuriensis x Pyrus communis]|uniref:Acyl-coenzyme A thioesterase 13-like n=1 Tax=Pyrus ussuriensis x Pyrus communis TaxID=2448454 RepID=A0A5N5IQ18_9ROSA|nr:acyl-coenzyme A thioesterase 13-like [Pyrus ussuriensis x Pyrus communis]
MKKEGAEETSMEIVKKFLEKEGEMAIAMDGLPDKFFEPFILKGINVDLLEPGHIVCSFTVPPRLVNGGNFLHGGATATLVDLIGSAAILSSGAISSGVLVEINVSYLDSAYPGEEVEIESRTLRVGKTVGVASVEIRKKKTGKIVAQGRHTKYLAVSSKL